MVPFLQGVGSKNAPLFFLSLGFRVAKYFKTLNIHLFGVFGGKKGDKKPAKCCGSDQHLPPPSPTTNLGEEGGRDDDEL